MRKGPLEETLSLLCAIKTKLADKRGMGLGLCALQVWGENDKEYNSQLFDAIRKHPDRYGTSIHDMYGLVDDSYSPEELTSGGVYVLDLSSSKKAIDMTNVVFTIYPNGDEYFLVTYQGDEKKLFS